jgi:acyl carrier protein
MPHVQRQPPPPVPDTAAALIDVVRRTVVDLRQHDADSLPIDLDSTLQDLGLDSLARVELFTRVEKEFGIRLPESLFSDAETVRHILAALSDAAAAPTRPASPGVAEPAMRRPATLAPPSRAATLGEVLAWHANHHPDTVQIIVCRDDADDRITYAGLWQQARAIAGGLQHHGIRMGDTIALMLPTSADYFCAFFGVLLAGGVPVPLYPPTRLGQIEEHVRRHAGILENSGAAILITQPEMMPMAEMLRMHARTLRRITTNAQLLAAQAVPLAVGPRPDAIALLQYTSGSTGQPKGVTLTHANLLANISALGAASRIESTDVFVSWLPLYHDMGLIGAWLSMLYFGLPLVIMSPLSFLTRPARWLQTIHRYGGTLSAAPNFAYELCLKRITDDELEGVNLSSWRLALNGAEAVMPATITSFQERFGRWGLRPTALTPVYGLAESSLGVAFPPLDRGPLIDVIEREPFMKNGTAIPASTDATNPLRFVSCGVPLARHHVRIVGDDGRERGERLEGRLEFQGPSATQGYFHNPEATRRLIHDGWLDSGDRAYIAAGEIYPTGRIKDIIIRAGRHIYPDELETAIGTINGVRKGCVAVFGDSDSATGTERVVVLAETHIEEPSRRNALRQQIVQRTVALIGEAPDDIVLAAPHTVLKTSSGKIRRAASREIYQSGGRRSVEPRPAWQQLLRLSVSAVGPATRRMLRHLLELGYAAYFWTLFALIATATYVLILLPLPAAIRWSIAHRAAQTFVRLAGIPFDVLDAGGERAQDPCPCIVVANHSSYLDGLFLLATLPGSCRFVAKRELERIPLVRSFLRRLGAEFVERFDARASSKDAQRLAAIAGHGHSLIFFPEGTFTRAPGLMPFHLGAFATAVAARLPVVPIALQGTRSLLRDQQWLPRRVAISAYIGSAIQPPGLSDEFAASVQLRDAAREPLRQHCGEPELLEGG